MKKIALGQTGLEISPLCLGTMYFGTRVIKSESYALMDHFMEEGGNFLDTANCYSFWVEGGTGDESETIIGEWLADRGNRSQVVLASKVGARPARPGSGDPEGTRAHRIIRSLEESLRRLGTDYLDLFYVHLPDESVPMPDILGAMEKLKKQGKIRAYACSNYTAHLLRESQRAASLQGLEGFACVQNWFSYLRPRSGADMWRHVFVNEAVLECCERTNLPIVAYSPLLSGIYDRGMLPDASYPALVDRFVSEENKTRMEKILRLSGDLGHSPSQIVLAWLMSRKAQVIPLMGVSRMSQLEDNLGSLDFSLTEEQIHWLDEL